MQPWPTPSFSDSDDYIGCSISGVATKTGFSPPVPSKELVPKEAQTMSLLIPYTSTEVYPFYMEIGSIPMCFSWHTCMPPHVHTPQDHASHVVIIPLDPHTAGSRFRIHSWCCVFKGFNSVLSSITVTQNFTALKSLCYTLSHFSVPTHPYNWQQIFAPCPGFCLYACSRMLNRITVQSRFGLASWT